LHFLLRFFLSVVVVPALPSAFSILTISDVELGKKKKLEILSCSLLFFFSFLLYHCFLSRVYTHTHTHRRVILRIIERDRIVARVLLLVLPEIGKTRMGLISFVNALLKVFSSSDSYETEQKPCY
jgi:hypothetical protein